jgi:hypothetical protein
VHLGVLNGSVLLWWHLGIVVVAAIWRSDLVRASCRVILWWRWGVLLWGACYSSRVEARLLPCCCVCLCRPCSEFYQQLLQGYYSRLQWVASFVVFKRTQLLFAVCCGPIGQAVQPCPHRCAMLQMLGAFCWLFILCVGVVYVGVDLVL